MPTCEPDKFVNREKELAYLEDKIGRLARGEPFAPHERVVHFVGPSGIGKSCLLEKYYSVTDNKMECIPLLIKLESIQKLGNFAEEFLAFADDKFSGYLGMSSVKKTKGLQQFSSAFLRKINKTIIDKIFMLFLDEINLPQKDELQAIEEYLLEKLLQDNKRVVLITAGRSPAGLNDFALRPRPENTFVLSAFNEKITGEQVEKLKPGSAKLAGKILDLGNGVPGHNKKLVDHVMGDPPNIPDELKAVQSLLDDVKSIIPKHFHLVVEAICILPSFIPDDVTPLLNNHPVLGGQWDETKIKEVFFDLKQVQIGPGGLINWDREKKSWAVDKSTRDLFERELKMREPGLWRKLHCIAYQMYKQWGTDHNSQFYKDKAAYHQQCLQSAGELR